jgi:hypothetical protein
MVQTPTERSREFRKRKQEKLAKVASGPTPYIVGDFAAFLQGDHPVFARGEIDPEIEGPRGAYVTPLSVADWADERLGDIGLKLDWRDIKKASTAVTSLSEAASCIAEVLNLFKWLEVNAAIKRLEETDLSDSNIRNSVFRELRRLGDISKGLTKTTRLNLPVISVLGETEIEDSSISSRGVPAS